jgi:hypothetical protein
MEEVRLSSLDLNRIQQRDGRPGVDQAAYGKKEVAKPLSIAGKTYEHGCGTQAPSVLHLELQGGTRRFTAQVGVQDEGNAKNNGGAEFVIEGDDKVLWTSPLMREGKAAQAVDLGLSGVRKLALKVNGGFDSALDGKPRYAYGCSRFCLARGDKDIAKELWPAIQWCLEYSKRKTNADGVVASDSDELEGRLPTGKANLSTSSLHYGGLRAAADLGRALGYAKEAKDYDQQADAMAKAIKKYFGAKVEGFDTYRYYAGNDVLRSWICLPLCMDIMDRRDGTVAALFSPRLWTADGLASQAGDLAFWDRSTLYGLRGVLQAGETKTGMRYLADYTKRRLLGDHVPYPVEAWPEGDQRHLSSESALYCRIYTEGLFGMRPTGLNRFRCTPRLPDGWPRMALRSVRAFNRTFDVVVERHGEGLRLTVSKEGKTVAEKELKTGDSAEIQLP